MQVVLQFKDALKFFNSSHNIYLPVRTIRNDFQVSLSVAMY